MTGTPLDSAATARAAARAILASGRFRTPSVPRPLHGVLVAIGHGISSPLHAIEHAVNAVGKVIPGGVVVVWALLAAVLALAVAFIATRGIRRVERAPQSTTGGPPASSPTLLERRAAAAEAAGRLEEALRLRFAAGLARIAERGAVADPTRTPTAELQRRLRSAEFDILAERFDAVVYGGDPASREDLERARRDWPHVVKGAA